MNLITEVESEAVFSVAQFGFDSEFLNGDFNQIKEKQDFPFGKKNSLADGLLERNADNCLSQIKNMKDSGWDITFDDSKENQETVLNFLKSVEESKASKKEIAKGDKSFLRQQKQALRGLLKKIGYSFEKKGSFLGSGAFGSVFRAKTKEKYIVALKIQIFRPEPMRLDLIIKEIDDLKSQNNHGAVHAQKLLGYSLRIYPDGLLILIETEAGVSVKSLMKENKGLNAKEKGQMVRDLVEQVFSLHSQGIAHLDIKPENIIFLESSQKYRLIDFGMSMSFDLKKPGETKQILDFRGTGFYASPIMNRIKENHSNKNIYQDPFKSDVYSLGVTLLEISLSPIKLKPEEIQKLKTKEFDVGFNDSFELMENAINKRVNSGRNLNDFLCDIISTLENNENEEYKENAQEKYKKVFQEASEWFHRRLNIIELALEENEDRRVSIFELALIMNMRHCFTAFERPSSEEKKLDEEIKSNEKKENSGFNHRIEFPKSSSSIRFIEKRNMTPHFCDNDILEFYDGRTIKLKEFFFERQSQLMNFKQIELANQALRNNHPLLEKGAFSLELDPLENIYRWVKIAKFENGVKLILWESDLELSENYLKFLLCKKASVYQKLKVKVKKGIPSSVLMLFGVENFYDIQEMQIVLYSDKEDVKKGKKTKTKLIFRPTGKFFQNNILLHKFITRTCHFLIKYSKNLQSVKLFDDFDYKIPFLVKSIAMDISKFKRKNFQFQRFIFRDGEFAFSYHRGWDNWTFIFPEMFTNNQKIIQYMEKNYLKIGSAKNLCLKHSDEFFSNIPIKPNDLKSLLKFLFNPSENISTLTVEGFKDFSPFFDVLDFLLAKCTKLKLIKHETGLILDHLEQILQKAPNLTTLVLKFKGDPVRKKFITMNQSLKRLKFKGFVDYDFQWNFLFCYSNWEFLKNLESLEFHSCRDEMLEPLIQNAKALPNLAFLSFKEQAPNINEFDKDRFSPAIQAKFPNLKLENLRFRWLEKINYIKPNLLGEKNLIEDEYEETFHEFQRKGYSKFISILEKREKVQTVTLDERHLNSLKIHVLQDKEFFKKESIEINCVTLHLEPKSYKAEFFEDYVQFLEDWFMVSSYEIGSKLSCTELKELLKIKITTIKKKKKLIKGLIEKINKFRYLELPTEDILTLIDAVQNHKTQQEYFQFEQVQLIINLVDEFTKNRVWALVMQTLINMSLILERKCIRVKNHCMIPRFRYFLNAKNLQRADFKEIVLQALEDLKENDPDIIDFVAKRDRNDDFPYMRDEFYCLMGLAIKSHDVIFGMQELVLEEQLPCQEEKELFPSIVKIFCHWEPNKK